MKNVIPTLMILMAACAVEEKNPPPLDPTADPCWPEVCDGSESDTGEPPPVLPTCDDFLACALDCSAVDFGDMTAELRARCVEACPAPELPDDLRDFLTSWGVSCATPDSDPDAQLCADGLSTCEHFEQAGDPGEGTTT